jgi:DUF1680 family protein
VRVPGWSRGQAWPTDLYNFLEPTSDQPTLAINGEPIAVEPVMGYAVIERAWQPGDKVTLSLPMSARRVVANDKVAADRGRVALLRGPLVFCVEGADVEGGKVGDLVLPDDAPLTSEYRSPLVGGVEVVQAEAKRIAADSTSTNVSLTAIPYYAWANRGKGEMVVWLPRTAEVLEGDNGTND